MIYTSHKWIYNPTLMVIPTEMVHKTTSCLKQKRDVEQKNLVLDSFLIKNGGYPHLGLFDPGYPLAI